MSREYGITVCSRGTAYNATSDDLVGSVAVAQLAHEQGFCAAVFDTTTGEIVGHGGGESDCYDGGSCFMTCQEPSEPSDEQIESFWRGLLQ